MKYIVVVNQYEESYTPDQAFHEWEREPQYENGKKVFYVVDSENQQLARHSLVRKLMNTYKDEYNSELLWYIREVYLSDYDAVDKEFLANDFVRFKEIIDKYEGKMTEDEFKKEIPEDLKLIMYQELTLSTYHAFEYSVIDTK